MSDEAEKYLLNYEKLYRRMFENNFARDPREILRETHLFDDDGLDIVPSRSMNTSK